jgi:hypothetical protein
MLFIFAGVVPAVAQDSWRVARMGWEISCGVDRGSLERQQDRYIFRTSSNRCQGGIFAQRSEISSDHLSVNRPATYLFDTTLQMMTASDEPFVVFQIHDGRNGCAPPMSVRWQSNNTLSFDSDYTMDRGMDGCVQNNELMNARYSGPRLSRDGNPHLFRARITFDGQGGFDITIEVDGISALSGRYAPPDDARFIRSKRFYFKHGVYSQRVWPYELVSTGMRMLQARN